jgi:predicted metalloprotease with PDZ domain
MTEIHYTVDARNHVLNCLNVDMSFTHERGTAELAMPVWSPGSYQVEDYARHIVAIDAFNASGRRLRLEKTDKSTWRLRADGGEIKVRYRVDAHRISVHHSFFDDAHLTINGPSVFLSVKGLEKLPAVVEIIPHEGWNSVSTGLRHTDAKWKFRAENYDILLDSPIEAGTHGSVHFECMGRDHEIAIRGPGTIDSAKFAADVEKIVRAEIAIMRDVPYDRYVFIYDLVPGAGGGLEHLNSTHCLADPFYFGLREEYLSKLSTISHEFFHLWNVKRLRPVPLGPFDYSKEVYTKLLWFSEGFTSYYTYIAMRKAGIISTGELMRSYARAAETFLSTPGRHYQSAEESSFDAWIKYYKPDENTVNSVISYYTKGQLIGMLLDIFIIDATGARRRLDDVMRMLYQSTYMKGRGFTEEDFIRSLESVSGRKCGGIYREMVSSRGDLPFGRYLSLAGIAMKRERERREGYLGIRMSETAPETVGEVLEGTGAALAALHPGDEIIAVDGMRVKSGDIAGRIREHRPGGTVAVTVSRLGVLKELRAELGERPGTLRFVQSDDAGAKQKRNYEKWAYAKWKDGISYEDVKDPQYYRKRFDII